MIVQLNEQNDLGTKWRKKEFALLLKTFPQKNKKFHFTKNFSLFFNQVLLLL
jgi:hypothetical protein